MLEGGIAEFFGVKIGKFRLKKDSTFDHFNATEAIQVVSHTLYS